jgi:quinol monooxygenase YgiN
MTSTTTLVRHRVANYDAWKTVYDNFATMQAENGVRAHHVLRSQNNPNDIVVLHTFDNVDTAKKFFDMPELKQAMGKAGVEADSIKITFYDEVEAGTLIAV